MTWTLWALLLLCQNASFTLVSRARNSGSLKFHAIASVFSNGIYIWTIQFLIDFRDRDVAYWVVALVYVVMTVTGSVLMHHVSRTYLERGNRRVGA